MGEADNEMESDGKGLFIIRNGKKIAKHEAGKWVPLLPGVVVRVTPAAKRSPYCRRAAKPPGKKAAAGSGLVSRPFFLSSRNKALGDRLSVCRVANPT